MFSWLKKYALACLRPVRRYSRMNRDDLENELIADDSCRAGDSFYWCKDIERHCFGEFSFAVARANEVIEDNSQVETGNNAVFVGVYDGHGGPEASRYVSEHLFSHFIRLVRDNGGISEETLRGAISATEEAFLTVVRRGFGIKPQIAAVGTCCLAGVISRGMLFTANLGDSRAVIGSLSRSNKIVAEQLTKEHNACLEEVRRELRSLHPDDPQVVVLKEGAWRVKGIIQVSRSIGDAYLKRPEFSFDASFPRFYIPNPIQRPILSAEPSMFARVLRPNDKFVIFASDGLWEYLTNQQAVEIVHNHPRNGIAGRLVRAALIRAAKRSEIRYNELIAREVNSRRYLHDDITVVVVFIEHELLVEAAAVQELSVRSFADAVGPSEFRTLH